MPNYTATNGSSASAGTQQATAAAYAGAVLGLNSSTSVPVRSKVYDLLIGTNGTPADNFVEWDVSRVTTSSTATILTPQPLDMADAASRLVVTANSSTHATISLQNLWYVGINQRASYRWVAAPGSEIVAPATSSAGLQLRQRSGAYTGTVTGSWMWME
jgi:hypothetical protein